MSLDPRCETWLIGRLVFMTYNGWVMIAVSLGAFIGYILFGEDVSSTKDNACH